MGPRLQVISGMPHVSEPYLCPHLEQKA